MAYTCKICGGKATVDESGVLVCSSCGRKQEVPLFEAESDGKNKKYTAIIAAVIAVAVIVFVAAAAFAAWFIFKPKGEAIVSSEISATEETSLPETELVTDEKIYNEARALIDSGDYSKAMDLISQIPSYEGVDALLETIYSKYEGYYQNGDVNLHLDITDNSRVDVAITVLYGNNSLRIIESAEIAKEKVSLYYTDNFQNKGKLALTLENDGVRLSYGADENNFTGVFFKLADKSLTPLYNFTLADMLDWMKNSYSYSQIISLGYELEAVKTMTGFEFPDNENTLYKIKDTEIYLSMIRFHLVGADEIWFKEQVLVGIAAPAEWIAPTLIGQKTLPIYGEDIIYWPCGYLFHYSTGHFVSDYFADTSGIINPKTMIGVAYRANVLQNEWENLIKSIYVEYVLNEAKPVYEDKNPNGHFSAMIYGENKTHYLVKVSSSLIEEGKSAWYKINKESKEVVFVQEGPYDSSDKNLAKQYPDLSKEFPGVFSSTPEVTTTKATTTAAKETGFKSYLYKVNNSDRKIYKQPTYNSAVVQNLPKGTYTIVDEKYDSAGNLWGKLKSGLGWILLEENPPMQSSALPYLVKVKYSGHNIFSQPSYGSKVVQALPTGTYTIVAEQYDNAGNLWGKLKSGLGWVCITEIQR